LVLLVRLDRLVAQALEALEERRDHLVQQGLPADQEVTDDQKGAIIALLVNTQHDL
jgi:hypothetical protein